MSAASRPEGARRKKFLPLTFGMLNGKRGWHAKAPDAPRLLYRLNALSHAAADATVLLCEGEKAADAAQRLFPTMIGMTWMGGSSADAEADFSPLSGRAVVLWPDADQVGRDVMARIAKQLPQARVLDTEGLRDGFDAADLEQEGCEDPEAWLSKRLREPPKDKSEPFVPSPWIYRDPTTIQPRKWLLGATLLRGYATVLASMGGVGKTALAITFALALITGRHNIAGQHVFQRGKVWIITLEDDREELERRIAAAMLAHGVKPHEIEGSLFRQR
jgi:hypothetical protein